MAIDGPQILSCNENLFSMTWVRLVCILLVSCLAMQTTVTMPRRGGRGGQKASLMYSVYWTPKGSANDSDQSYVTIPLEFLFLSQKCFLVEKSWTVINKAPCPNTFEILARVDENRN